MINKLTEAFDVLMFIHGVAIGLALTRSLQFIGLIMVGRRKNVTFFHMFWLLSLIIYTIQYWFYTIKWKGAIQEMSFAQYCLSIAMPLLYYLMSVIICPTEEETQASRTRTYFAENGWMLFVLVGISLYLAAAEGWLIQTSDMLAYKVENFSRIAFGSGFLAVGIWFRNYKTMETLGPRKYVPVAWLFLSVIFRAMMGASTK